jgi:hypothetical protein
MPNHEFRNKSGDLIDQYYSIYDEVPKRIKVNNQYYWRIISKPNLLIDTKRPKTIASLAEQNTNRMRKEGKLPPAKEKIQPFWRKGKVNTDLSKLSKERKMRYIKEGKL